MTPSRGTVMTVHPTDAEYCPLITLEVDKAGYSGPEKLGPEPHVPNFYQKLYPPFRVGR